MDIEPPVISIFQSLLSTIRGIGNEKHSEREENLKKFPLELSSFLSQPEIKSSENPLGLELIKSLREFLRLCLASVRWEDRFSGTFALELIVSNGCLSEFVLQNLNQFSKFLEEKEARLRKQASTLLGNLCKYLGFVEVFPLISQLVLPKIIEEANKPEGKILEANLNVILFSFQCLSEKVRLENTVFFEYIEVLGKVVGHKQGYIRSISVDILEKMLVFQPLKDFIDDDSFIEKITLWLELASADNITETRFHGTKTTGSFLLRLKRAGYPKLEKVASRLLPRVCFNRLYPAESFSKESQRIWREYVDMNGKQILGSLIAESIDYDLEEIKKGNWEVRTTACFALNELIGKVIVDNKEAEQKLLLRKGEILARLLELLGDHHNVREAAYTTIQTGLRKVFKDNSIEIYDRVIQNIGESYPNIQKLIVEVLQGLCENDEKGELVIKILGAFEEKLKNFKNPHSHQEHQEHIEGGMERKKHEHEGDCLDILVGFFSEMAKIYIKPKPQLVEKCLSVILNFSSMIRNEKESSVKDNIWSNLTSGVENAGKTFAKRYMDDLLTMGFEDIEEKEIKKERDSVNCVKKFVKKMQTFLGPNIIKSRVEALNGGKWSLLYSQIL